MTDHLLSAVNAAKRLIRLLVQLDQSTRPGDLLQVREGITIEARLIHRHLGALQEAAQDDAHAALADSPGLVRSDAPGTSRAAGRAVRTGTARGRILAHLASRGPHTDLELQEHLAIPANTQRPRRVELVDMGLVAPSSDTRVHAGREWTVWSITHAGEGVARTLADGVDVVYPARMPEPVPSTSDGEWGDGTLF